MARPNQQGLSYFSFDVDFFEDIKVRRIKKDCGASSISILFCLLCNIYRDNGYYIGWNEDMAFVIAETVGVTEGAVLEVIKKAVQVGFFDKEKYDSFGILTSKGIQRRYEYVVKSAKLKREPFLKKYNLLESSEEIEESSEYFTKSSEEIDKNSEESTQRKGNKKKERERRKEKKEIPPPENPIFKKIEYSALKPLSEIKDEILNDIQYLEIIAMNNHLGSVDKSKEWIELFHKQLQNEGVMRKSLQDFKSHFGRWLPIKLQQENGKEQKKTGPTVAKF